MGNHRSAVNSANGSRQGRAAFWSADREALLCSLWAKGLYAADIAELIGDGCTPAMINSKAHRLKLGSHVHLQSPGRPAPKESIRVPRETSEAA